MDKILVIDDEKPTLSMFRLFLGAYGFEVLTAENGETGLELFGKERPPIVLTDIKMPGMDGLEVLERIKKVDPRAEVIIITGHGDMDLAIKALNLNATDFINKPIHKEALDAALKRAGERLSLARGKEKEITSEKRDGKTVISIKGNLDSALEPYLRAEYEKALQEAKGIVLDFDESSSVNGVGISLLKELLDTSMKRNMPVAISGLSENFRKVFEMVGITQFADIFKGADKALETLRA